MCSATNGDTFVQLIAGRPLVAKIFPTARLVVFGFGFLQNGGVERISVTTSFSFEDGLGLHMPAHCQTAAFPADILSILSFAPTHVPVITTSSDLEVLTSYPLCREGLTPISVPALCRNFST